MTELIDEKTLASLGVLSTLCATMTEVLKSVFQIHPILISFTVATILSAVKFVLSKEYTLRNALLTMVNIIPIVLTSNGEYDVLNKIR